MALRACFYLTDGSTVVSPPSNRVICHQFARNILAVARRYWAALGRAGLRWAALG